MLWEKKNPKKPEGRGYLYLRESIYVRDKRSHTRKPNKLGSGKAKTQRGKYTKKKDIYCGKIIEIKPNSLLTFHEYLDLEDIAYLEFKINSDFNQILTKFVEYILYMYDIDKNTFYTGQKIAYEVNGGYLSTGTIDNIKKFVIRGRNSENKNEIERFANRCYDAGVFDEEIIMNLYVKITPDLENKEEIETEIKELRKKGIKRREHNSFMDFMRKEHN
jgi:hypothetical protein